MRRQRSPVVVWPLFAVLAAGVAACAGRAPALPQNVSLGAAQRQVESVTAARSADPPRILDVWLSSNDVARGSTWSGRIVTTTNTASVEVRTNLFSLNVPRVAYGRFAFAVDVFDLPPIFLRPYVLRVIARNAAGVAAEEDLPFRLR